MSHRADSLLKTFRKAAEPERGTMQRFSPVAKGINSLRGGRARGTIPYEPLRPIMNACGTTQCSPEQFYWAVNRAYHEAEAPFYEHLHAHMFKGLRAKWERLTSPLLGAPARSLGWLDVGCGTGLVGSFLAELLGDRICEGVLVDTSSAMLGECRRRARDWPFSTSFVVGTIESLQSEPAFDLVTVDSVIHHVVDLESFCARIAGMVRSGGFLLTCQDPRGEASSDLILKARAALVQYLHPQSIRYRLLEHLPEPVVRLVRRLKRKRP